MRGVMRMDIGDFGAVEQFANSRVRLPGERQCRIAQIPVGIKAAQCNRTTFKYRRSLVDIFCRLLRFFADIDGIGRAIGCRDVMTDMMKQDKALPLPRIVQRDAAGKACASCSGHPTGIDTGKLCIIHFEQMRMSGR